MSRIDLTGLRELQGQLNQKLDGWQESLTTWQTTVNGFNESLGQIKNQIEQLKDVPEELKSVVEQKWGGIVEQFETFSSTLSVNVDEKQERLVSLKEFAVNLIESKFEDLEESINDAHNKIVERFKKAWCDATEELIDDSKEQLKACVENQVEQFMKVGDVLKESIKKSIGDLKTWVADELSDTVEAEGRKTLESAMERVKDEVLDAIVTSQIQVQITGYLSPYIPHLAAAKALAPAVQKALDVMRAGF